MQISIDKKSFDEALAVAKNIAPGADLRASLNGLLLEASIGAGGMGMLKISATDLEVGLTAHLACEVKEPGSALLNARKLSEIVSKLGGAQVSLDANDDNFTTIKSGGAKFKIPGLDVRSFPAMDRGDEPRVKVAIAGAELKALADKSSKVISNSTVANYAVHGALLQAKTDVMRMVATDGHRLTFCERAAGMEKGQAFGDVIIPRKGVLELARLIAAGDGSVIELEVGTRMIVARHGSRELSMRLLEGAFPDYAAVVPGAPNVSLVVKREAILDALDRVTLVTDPKFRAIQISVSNQGLILTARPGAHGEAVEVVGVESGVEKMADGAVIAMDVNADYVIDAIAGADGETVQLDLIDSASKIVVKAPADTSYSHIVAPVYAPATPAAQRAAA
jgi:DNA polymerase-3 subunit beta